MGPGFLGSPAFPFNLRPNSIFARMMERSKVPNDSFLRGSNNLTAPMGQDQAGGGGGGTGAAPITTQPVPLPASQFGGGGAGPGFSKGSNNAFSNLGIRTPGAYPQQQAEPFASVSTSYAAGGTVGPGGMAIRPGAGVQQGAMPPMQKLGSQAVPQELSPQSVDAYANQFMQQHPEQVAQIQQALQEAMATGELTPEELNRLMQMAQVAINEPSLWPQLRTFAIQQGIATEQDIPQQYDPALLYVVLVAAKAMQGMPPPQQGNMPPQQDMMQQGGQSPKVNIEAHEGEYVIPKNVVDMKGREFFDNLVGKYQSNG